MAWQPKSASAAKARDVLCEINSLIEESEIKLYRPKPCKSNTTRTLYEIYSA